MSIKIYCDSSFDQYRSVAGWGVVVQDGNKERLYSNWIPADNINIGEIFAIHTACVLLGGKTGTIYTDSQTALAYIKGEIKDKPRTTEQYIRHRTMEYWAYRIRKFDIKIEKIKAHQKTIQLQALGNNMADLKAKEGLAKFYLTMPKNRVR